MVRIHQWHNLRPSGRWNQIYEQIWSLEVLFLYLSKIFMPSNGLIVQSIHLNIIVSSSFYFRYLIAFKNLLRAIENIGIVSVYGIKYLTTGKVTQENFIKYVEHDTLIWEYLNSSIHLAPYLNEKLQNIYSSKAYKFYRERYLASFNYFWDNYF